MKKVIRWGSAIAVGAVLGLGATALALLGAHSGVNAGVWHTSTLYGSADADMYTRARLALFGLLALDKEETLYYVAARDSAGEALSGDCTYAITGQDLAARWWSITAYGPDKFLIPNGADLYSFSKTTVKREPGGGFVIRVSAAKQDGNWLPVKRGSAFDLTARLYNPEPSVYASPGKAVLPIITKESCP